VAATGVPGEVTPTGAARAAANAVPAVAGVSQLTASSLKLSQLTYDGIVDLHKVDGTVIKVLAFSLNSAEHTPFRLQTRPENGRLTEVARTLAVSGQVHFYCTSLTGNTGIFPVTFTPERPPQKVDDLDLTLSAVSIELVYVRAETLTSSDFALSAG
jgi:hypothetical protein